MPYPLGTKIGAPLTNGDPAAKFGTHIDYLGIGGFRSVPTIVDRDAIPVKPVIEYDGGGSGMRREGMLVYCQDTKKTYQLSIPNYNNLSDTAKLVQLADNTNFFEVQFGTLLNNGETILDIRLDGTDLIVDTNVTTRTIDLSTLGDVHKDYVDAADAALQAQITENAININTIVTGAPSALDTLKEIADQIAADEAGVAGILATQQQHTQQLATLKPIVAGTNITLDNNTTPGTIIINAASPSADVNKAYVDAADANLQSQIDNIPSVNDANLVHKAGDESIAGNKTFTNEVTVGGDLNAFNYKIDSVTVMSSPAGSRALRIGEESNGLTTITNCAGGFYWYSPSTYKQMVLDGNGNLTVSGSLTMGNTYTQPSGITAYNTVYKVYSENGGLQLQSRDGDVSIGSGGLYGHTPNLVVTNGGNVGINTTAPTEKLEVAGNVKADFFIGDGSRLTGLPSGGANVAYVNQTNTFTETQQIGVGTDTVTIQPNAFTVQTSSGESVSVTAYGMDVSDGNDFASFGIDGITFADGSVQNTAASGDVTKAYVDAADTALGNRITTNTTDIATNTTAIAAKAPKDSPDFTGIPTAPVVTNTSPGNQIATADYVRKSFSTAPLITAIGFDGVIRYDFTELQPAVFWSQRNNQGGHGAYGGYEGYVILGRPILTNDCGQIGIGGTVDANNNAISANPYGFTLYSGSQIINNSLYFGSTIYIRDNSYSTVKPRIQGGIVAAAFNFSAGTTSTLILDGVTVTDCGGPAYLEGGKRVSTDGGGTIILRNGAKFLNFPPHSTTTVITEGFVRTSTTVTFDADAEYNPVYSGTFTVSDTNKVVGKVVTIYLGPSATQPTIPTTGYKLISGAYEAGKNLMYMFKVGANNQIQYTISNVD